MKLSKFELLLLTFALFSSAIFFSFYLVTGRVYGGASNDSSYISFVMAVNMIPLLLFLKMLITKHNNMKNVWMIVLILLVLVAIYGMDSGIGDINFKSLVAFSIPAALIGILIAKSNSGSYFAKLLEPVMLFFTFTGIISMRHILSVAILRDVQNDGIGTNSLSYYCGFAFALNLYFLLFGDEMTERFKYAKTSLYKYISIFLLIVQFAVGLSSGGRGGFILLLVSGIVLTFLRFKRHSAKSANTFITFILLFLAIIVAIQFMPQNIVDAMSRGSERTFSYISKGRIDATETSNRDVVYDNAFRSISESPIIGHGLLMKGTPFYQDRPHNIFLEILLQGGVFYLLLFLIFMFHILKKMRMLIRQGNGLYMIPVALYPMVMLMFSASYIGADLFWFVISFIICSDVKASPRHF